MKHPVPKQKKSKLRSRQRYGNYARKVKTRLSELVVLTTDPVTGEKYLRHHVSPSSGYYRGRDVLKLGAKATKGVKKVKA